MYVIELSQSFDNLEEENLAQARKVLGPALEEYKPVYAKFYMGGFYFYPLGYATQFSTYDAAYRKMSTEIDIDGIKQEFGDCTKVNIVEVTKKQIMISKLEEPEPLTPP